MNMQSNKYQNENAGADIYNVYQFNNKNEEFGSTD
jgi:hypothetical protein